MHQMICSRDEEKTHQGEKQPKLGVLTSALALTAEAVAERVFSYTAMHCTNIAHCLMYMDVNDVYVPSGKNIVVPYP